MKIGKTKINKENNHMRIQNTCNDLPTFTRHHIKTFFFSRRRNNMFKDQTIIPFFPRLEFLIIHKGSNLTEYILKDCSNNKIHKAYISPQKIRNMSAQWSELSLQWYSVGSITIVSLSLYQWKEYQSKSTLEF